MQGKVNKLISLRFAESTDPIGREALAILAGISGSYDEIWQARTKMIAEWYKCWKAEQDEGVAGNDNDS